MKKTLSFILALVLTLGLFADVTVFADDDPIEWDHYLVFSYGGYEYGKPAEGVSVGFARADWSWAFDGVSAYLEAEGEQVAGLIADGIEYTLVIKLKIIPGIDEYYGFSSLTKDTVKLNNKKASSPTAFEYYSDGEYLVAKFALAALAPAYNSVDFSIDGYALGANAEDVVVAATTEGINVRRAEVCIKENPEGPYKPVEGELEAGKEYVLIMDYIAPEGIAIQPFAKASLYGAGDKPVVNNGVCTIDNGLGYGRAYYLSDFALPVLEDTADWDHILVLGYSGYKFNNSVDDLTAYFAYTDWNWAFDGASAYLEADGERVTGVIEAGIDYTLVIKLKIIPEIDEYYCFSSIPKEQVKLFKKDPEAKSAIEYYSDGEYLIAKFELARIQPTYTSLEFVLEGYALGESADSISVISNTEGAEIRKPLITVYDEATGREKNYYGELEPNVEYGLTLTFFVPDGYDVDPQAEVSLFGFGDEPIAPDGVVSQWVAWVNGRDLYACSFTLPVLEAENKNDENGDTEFCAIIFVETKAQYTVEELETLLTEIEIASCHHIGGETLFEVYFDAQSDEDAIAAAEALSANPIVKKAEYCKVGNLVFDPSSAAFEVQLVDSFFPIRDDDWDDYTAELGKLFPEIEITNAFQYGGWSYRIECAAGTWEGVERIYATLQNSPFVSYVNFCEKSSYGNYRPIGRFTVHVKGSYDEESIKTLFPEIEIVEAHERYGGFQFDLYVNATTITETVEAINKVEGNPNVAYLYWTAGGGGPAVGPNEMEESYYVSYERSEATVITALSALRIAADLSEVKNDVYDYKLADAIWQYDCDGDKAITVSDALRLLRIAAKLA